MYFLMIKGRVTVGLLLTITRQGEVIRNICYILIGFMYKRGIKIIIYWWIFYVSVSFWRE